VKAFGECPSVNTRDYRQRDDTIQLAFNRPMVIVPGGMVMSLGHAVTHREARDKTVHKRRSSQSLSSGWHSELDRYLAATRPGSNQRISSPKVHDDV
jgi:SLT domain-containing protein